VNDTEMERELMRLMNIAAGDPPSHVTVAQVRRGVIRRRLATSAVAAAAVLICGAAAAVSASAGTTSPATGQPAGVPRYYVEQSWVRPGFETVVRATAGGAVTGTVRCPGRRGGPTNQYAVAAHQTYFMECVTGAGTTRIYRFRLTAAGRPVSLRPVPGGYFRSTTSGLAAAANGAEVALAVYPNGTYAGARVVVINTRTGARATWLDAAAGPGSIRLNIQQLSLTASGRELVVFGPLACVRGAAGSACRARGQEAVAVSPAARGGSLSQGRLILRRDAIISPARGSLQGAIITAGGRSVLATVGTFSIKGRASMFIDQVSAATGRLQRVLYRLGPARQFGYRFVTVDPTSRWLLVDAGSSPHMVNGWVDRGHLVPLRPAGVDVEYEAW
jgi:hypothetical protein